MSATPAPRAQLDRLLADFEDAWRRREPPAIDRFLEATAGSDPGVLFELVRTDLRCRLQAGEPARVENYLSRYPDLAADPALVLDLVEAEYHGRRPGEPSLQPDEYLGRFPQHGPGLSERLGTPPAELSQARTVPSAAPQKAAGGSSRPNVPGYEILGELGRGGMSIVFLARQLPLNRLVALKTLLAGPDSGPDERARFRAEAEAVAWLQHPNIVQIFEVGEADGCPYLALEFVEGGSLARLVAGNPQPPRDAARIMEILARAVHFAHQQGIIHRDLKPSNVLLQVKDQQANRLIPDPCSLIPKLCDFGLARRLDADAGRTRTGMVIGTPGYMAPEQAGGKGSLVGPAADVYSLGAILYELLTGRPPFQGESVLDTLDQVKNREPVPPRRLRPGVPRDLETVCLKCLEKEPGKRYPSAGLLAEDLRRFQAGEPVRARALSAPVRLGRWCRRNPRLAGLTAAVFTLLLTVAVTSSLFAWKLQRETEAKELARRAAEESARQARTAQRAADRSARGAREQHARAVNHLIGLVEHLQQRLEARSGLLRQAPELRAFKEELLRTAQKSITDLAGDLDRAGVTSFGMVYYHQKLGDLFRSLGDPAEALHQYRQGYEVVTRIAKEKPRLDTARGNRAFMLAKLGDAALDLTGNAGAARDYYRQALAVQEDVAAHPGDGFYKPADHGRLLANYVSGVGTADLRRGDPAAARKNFRRALGLRRTVAAADPRNRAAERALAEAHFWLGEAHGRLGDAAATNASFEACLRHIRALLKDAPADACLRFDLAGAHAAHGDARLRLGNPGAALRCYDQSLEVLKQLAPRLGEVLAFRSLVARAHYRRGTALLRLGDQDKASACFTLSLRIREELGRAHPGCLAVQKAWMVSLARCGRAGEADRLAGVVRKLAPESNDARVRVAGCYALCSAAAGSASDRQALVERALRQIRAAVAVGYRDAVTLRTDPDLDPLRDVPAFRDLLAQVKP